jgi:hypothetical protein
MVRSAWWMEGEWMSATIDPSAVPERKEGRIHPRPEGCDVGAPVVARRQPQQNGFVESFNGKLRDKLRDECLNEEVFANLAEARAVIERWRLDYNYVRPHSAHA